jgi:hypothetical protein
MLYINYDGLGSGNAPVLVDLLGNLDRVALQSAYAIPEKEGMIQS